MTNSFQRPRGFSAHDWVVMNGHLVKPALDSSSRFLLLNSIDLWSNDNLSNWCFGGLTVGCSTYDHEVLGSIPGRATYYQVVTIRMGDCLRTGRLSRYITNTTVNSAFHPSEVGKSSTGLSGYGSGGAR